MAANIPELPVNLLIYGEPVTPDVSNRPIIDLQNYINTLRLSVNQYMMTPAKEIDNYTCKPNEHVLVDNTSGGSDLFLPATPSIGTMVWITPLGTPSLSNRRITISPHNPDTIMGSADNLILDVDNYTLRLVFAGGTIGWEMM